MSEAHLAVKTQNLFQKSDAGFLALFSFGSPQPTILIDYSRKWTRVNLSACLSVFSDENVAVAYLLQTLHSS